MKILARNINSNPLVFNVEIYADHPIFYDDLIGYVAADIRPDLPDRAVITRNRKKLKGWMVDDFESFVERIEDFCEITMDLVGTYKNVSSDHSHYYNYLAKDSDGNIIAKIRMRLRISNHLPKRSSQQKYNKKQELESPKLHELLTPEQIANLESYVIVVVVNDEKFDSYEEAYDYITSKVRRAVEVMQR